MGGQKILFYLDYLLSYKRKIIREKTRSKQEYQVNLNFKKKLTS